MYLFLRCVSDTQCKQQMRCSILVSVTIYIVCTVLFDITYYLKIRVIVTRYARLFTWTVYINVSFFKVMIQLLNIAFYHCNHKLYIHSRPYCSQLTIIRTVTFIKYF